MLKLIGCLALFIFAELCLCRTANFRLSNLSHALAAGRIPPQAISLANLLARETTIFVPVSCGKTTYVTQFVSPTQLPGEKWQTSTGATTATSAPMTPSSFVTTKTLTTGVQPYSAAATTPSTGSPNSAAFTPGTGGSGGGGSSKPSLTPTPTPSTLIPVSHAVTGIDYSSILIGVWVLAFSFLVGT